MRETTQTTGQAEPRPMDIRRYFFFPEPKVGCQLPVFWLGAAAITLIFSFFGFLASRFPLCSPLAMSISPELMVVSELNVDLAGYRDSDACPDRI